MPPTPAPKKMGFLARLIATVRVERPRNAPSAPAPARQDLPRTRFYNPPNVCSNRLHASSTTFRTCANAVLRGAETSGALRLITVELGMSEEQQQLRERLSDQALAERAKTVEPSLLVEQARGEFSRFAAGFDAEVVRGIDAQFNRLAALLDLINYDYRLFAQLTSVSSTTSPTSPPSRPSAWTAPSTS
jgi:hypothetical protein